jgi:glycosyltransferase involved in cell wall biosynthesis
LARDPAPALVLAPETPYPRQGGGALRTASLLHYLAQTRPVDLIVFRQPGTPDPAAQLPAGLVRDVFVLNLPANRRDPAARTLRNLSRMARRIPPLIDRFSGFESEIEAALRGRRYGVGIVEHFWCAPYYHQIAQFCSETVLDLHNIESHLHERCAAAERGGQSVAHRVFERASQNLERTWLPRFSRVLVTSRQDADHVRALSPDARVTVYPNALTECPARSPAPPTESIAFSGNLEYHPNISAVRFFAREIWPSLRDRYPALVWRLIGKNPDAVRGFLDPGPRIELTGPVDDAVAELAPSRVAVAPLLAGSGTRFKILEAWAAGVPVVSTAIGAEGLPVRDGEHLLLADGARPFVAAVSRLLNDPVLAARLACAGRGLLEREFTWKAAWRNLDF